MKLTLPTLRGLSESKSPVKEKTLETDSQNTSQTGNQNKAPARQATRAEEQRKAAEAQAALEDMQRRLAAVEAALAAADADPARR